MVVTVFGMVLRDSPYKGQSSLEQSLSLVEARGGVDETAGCGGFISLARSMERIASMEQVSENR